MMIADEKRFGLPAELQRAASIPLSEELYVEARSRGMDLTRYLEDMDPSAPGATLDAFERQLALAGLRISGPEADTLDRFFASAENSILFPEFVSRSVRAGMLEFKKLDFILAQRTKIDDNTYRALYMD